jgi:hypothetical protein
MQVILLPTPKSRISHDQVTWDIYIHNSFFIRNVSVGIKIKSAFNRYSTVCAFLSVGCTGVEPVTPTLSR